MHVSIIKGPYIQAFLLFGVEFLQIKTEKKIKNSVAKSAIYFASGTMMSRVTGLLRDNLLVTVFGVSVSDAWLAAFRFPNLFRRIFGEGALSACFIPLYVEYKDQKNERALAQLTAGVLGLLLCVLIPLTILFVLGMDSIISYWVHGKGFTDVPGKVEMTVTMTKIMFPFLLLMMLFAYFMAVLNAHKQFLLSALAPLFFNLIIIVASLYCYWSGFISAYFLSWAVIVGGVVQFAVLVPSFMRLKVPFDWQWKSLSSPPVQKVLKAFLPSVLGLGIIQLMGFVNTSFASELSEGAVTSIYLADRLLELPLSLVAVSLSATLLPTLSEYISQNNESGFKAELFKNIKLLFLLCVPAGVGLWMTSSLLVSVLYEGGEFKAEQGAVVAQIVRVYAFTLIGASLTRILGQAFYAEKKTMIPAVASFIGFVFHILVAPFLMDRWGLEGLVISTSIASFINCFVLLGLFYSRHGSLYFTSLLGFSIKITIASLAIVGVGWLQSSFFMPVTFLQKLIALIAVVFWSVVLFFIFAKALKVEEADFLLQKFVRRQKRPS